MLDRTLNPDAWAAVPFHFWSVTFFAFGCLWGSFLNVCIYRMPLGKSVVSPPSHCPHCGYSIPWYLNVPLVTWTMLRGKCANCRAPISVRYLLVELLTGILFLACWLRVGERSDPLPSLVLAAILCVFVAGLIVATFIDFEHFIIPDEITIGGMVVGFLFSLAWPALHFTASRGESLLQSGLGIAIGGGVVFAVLNGGKLLFGRKRLDFPENSTVTFHETELELPGAATELSRFAGYNATDGTVTITFARAFVGDEVLENGSLKAGPLGICVESTNSNFTVGGDVRFRLLEANPEPALQPGGFFIRLRRRLGKPPITLSPGLTYLIGTQGIRLASEVIPFEEMFFRKSDTLRLNARHAEICLRGGDPYPEVFSDMAVRLSPEKLHIGDREFDPGQVPFLRVTTDSVVVPREAMGFGDVKFMAGIGAFLGWKATIFSLMASAMIGSVIGGVLVVLGRKEWSSKIPYGPYIALAALIWLLGGREWALALFDPRNVGR